MDAVGRAIDLDEPILTAATRADHPQERWTASLALALLAVQARGHPIVVSRFVTRGYDRPPLRASLELARELVFGAEEYARGLGFEPHRDFEPCSGHLGTWSGPSSIVFGYHGKQGPNDDLVAVTEALE